MFARIISIKNKFIDSIKLGVTSFITNPKKYLADLARLSKAGAVFLFKASLKTIAFFASAIFFIEAIKFAMASSFVPAVIGLTAAVTTLRYSWVPYKVITTVLGLVMAPVKYVTKTAFLAVVDHLIYEFEIDKLVKDRPLNALFEVDQDLVTSADPNPSLTGAAQLDGPQLQVGVFTLSLLSGLRAAFPRELSYKNIKGFGVSTVNWLIFNSGLAARAQWLVEKPKRERQEQESLRISQKNFTQLQGKLQVFADLSNNINIHDLEIALMLLFSADKTTLQTKQQNGQNWLHYLQKINVPQDEKLEKLYAAVVQKIVAVGVSPYDRDNDGATAFYGHRNDKNDAVLRKAINNGNLGLIGIDYQINRLNRFVEEVKHSVGSVNDLGADRRLCILAGPPGVGKTEAIKAVMEENKVTIIEYSKGSAQDGVVGGQVTRIKALFKQAKDTGVPVCIFIDEIDSVLHNRETQANALHDALPINVFQQEITDLTGTNCFVVGGTNNYHDLKPAIQSRAGLPITFGYPDADTIIKVLHDKLREYKSNDFDKVITHLADKFAAMRLTPRDLNEFAVKAVDSNRGNNTDKILSIQGLENASKLLSARFNNVPGLRVLFGDLEPSKDNENFDLLTLDPNVLAQLNGLKGFFAASTFNIRMAQQKNLQRVLLQGFSAEKYLDIIANKAQCPVVYFDAATIDSDHRTEFLAKVIEKVQNCTKVVLVIDNVDCLKKAEFEKLSAVNKKDGLVYVMGAVETPLRKADTDLPLVVGNIWNDRIQVLQQDLKNFDRKKIPAIIKARILKAQKDGIATSKYLYDSLFVRLLSNDTVNAKTAVKVVDDALNSMLEIGLNAINNDGKTGSESAQPILTYHRMKQSFDNAKRKQDLRAADAQKPMVQRYRRRG